MQDFNPNPNLKKDSDSELNFRPRQLTLKLINLENTLTLTLKNSDSEFNSHPRQVQDFNPNPNLKKDSNPEFNSCPKQLTLKPKN